MLTRYAERFSLVEVASTFQGIPNQERVAEWAEAVPAGFVFDVVAFGGLTLHQRRPGDHAPTLKKSWTQLSVEPPDVLFAEFKDAIAPLTDSGLLGVVILQFPPWFEQGEPGFAYLRRCRELLGGLPLGIELRHRSWFEPEARRNASLDHLIDLEMALSVADFPAAGREAPALAPYVTFAGVAPLRLHGRARDSWEKIGASAAHVAEYAYSEADLREIAKVANGLCGEADEVHVIFNVSPAAEAVSAAEMLVDLVEEARREPDYTAWRHPKSV